MRNESVTQKILYTGNNVKSMGISLEQSLKNLRTTYIDLLYVHWWDWDTTMEEVMQGLNRLVASGKVLYLVCFLVFSQKAEEAYHKSSVVGCIGYSGMGCLQG